MNLSWKVIEISINLIESGLFLFLIGSKFKSKTKSVIPLLIALLLSTAAVSYARLYGNVIAIGILVGPAILFIYALIAYTGKMTQKLLWILVGTALNALAAAISILFVSMLPDVNLQNISQQLPILFQSMIISKILQTIMFFWIAEKKDLARLKNIPSIILLITVPLTSMITVILLLKYGLDSSQVLSGEFFLVCISMFILFINLTTIMLYETLTIQAKSNAHMQIEIKRYETLAEHNKNLTDVNRNIYEWRHDTHNHLQVIHGYLQLGEYERLDKYIKKIENNVIGFELPISSGNYLIDALLGCKIFFAHSNDIQIDVMATVAPEIKICDTDICELIGNLLDNAIEGCRRIDNKDCKRFIYVDIRTVKGNIFIIVKNSTDGNIKMRGARYISSKEDRPSGIGIKRINEITQSYGGYVNIRHENNIFETNIVIPNIELV